MKRVWLYFDSLQNLKVTRLESITLSIIIASQKHSNTMPNNSKAHAQIITWQQIDMAESTDPTQRSE